MWTFHVFQPEPPKKQSNWRKKHEDFIATIRAAKSYSHVTQDGGPLPPPPPPTYDPGERIRKFTLFQKKKKNNDGAGLLKYSVFCGFRLRPVPVLSAEVQPARSRKAYQVLSGTGCPYAPKGQISRRKEASRSHAGITDYALIFFFFFKLEP